MFIVTTVAVTTNVIVISVVIVTSYTLLNDKNTLRKKIKNTN